MKDIIICMIFMDYMKFINIFYGGLIIFLVLGIIIILMAIKDWV